LRGVFKFSIVFAAVYFFSLNGLAALPNLSLSFLLKEVLKLSPSGLAYFQAVTLLAWVVKPVWGYISDSFPVFGYRRKSYLLLTSMVAGFAWLFLAGIKTYTVSLLLTFITISYMAYAFQDVVTDALMVEVGKPLNLTGYFQAVQWGSVYLAMILTAVCGGYISDLARKGAVPYQWIFAATVIFPVLTLLTVILWVSESPKVHWELEAKTELKEVFKRKDFWFLTFFFFLWNFSPSFGAPFFYYFVDTLKFSGSFLGLLQGAASGAALLGSFLFGKYMTKIPIRKVLLFAIFSGVVMILFDLVYFHPWIVTHLKVARVMAFGSNILFGLINTLIFLTLLNLAAKGSPEHGGGTVFAFFMSVYNLGTMGSQILGGFLFPLTGLKPLILISAIFSLFALLVLPFLAIDEPLTPLEKVLKKGIRRVVCGP
jgi:MFS family permease